MALSDSCFVRPGEAWRLQRQGLGWNQVELHGRCLHPDTPGLVWGQDSFYCCCCSNSPGFQCERRGITVNKLYEKLVSIRKRTVSRLSRRGHMLLNIKELGN